LQIWEIDIDNEKKKDCRDFKKMQEILSKDNLFIQILFDQVDFKANDYQNPLKNITISYARNLNLNLQKLENFKLKNTIVEQDDGILFSDEKYLTNMYGIYPMEKHSFFRNNDELEKIYNSTDHKVPENVFNMFFFHDAFYDKYVRK